MSCSIVTNAMIKFNGKVEQFFYKLGGVVATYPLISITFSILFWGGFGFGLIKAKTENDIYKLWIEDNSRLHNERDFDALHFPYSTRTEFMIATPPNGANLMNAAALDEWLRLTSTMLDVGLNYTGDPAGIFSGNNFYDWEDVCSRYNTPLQLRGVFRISGEKDNHGPIKNAWANYPKTRGFPCSRYTVLDCFQEGRYDFALYPPTIQQFLQDRYNGTDLPPLKVVPKKPSFRGRSDEDLLAITAPSCSNSLGSFFPWNYLYGTVTRVNPADPQSNLTYVGSFQLIALTSSAKLFAKTWKTEKCIDKAEIAQAAITSGRKDATGLSDQLGNCATDNANCLSYIGAAKTFTKSNATYDNQFWQNDCYTQANKCAGDAVMRCVITCGGNLADQVPCLNSLQAVLGGANASSPAVYPACVDTPAELSGWLGVVDWVSRGMCSAAFASTTASSGCGPDVVQCLGAALSCYANELAGCQDEPTAAEYRDAENIIKGWETAFINHMATQRTAGGYQHIIVDYYAERSTSDLVDAAGSADASLIILGYLLEYGFVGLTFFQCSTLESRVLAGIFGMLLMCVSMVSCLGLTVLSGIPLSPTIVQVLPFVGLGLGVDLLFVLGGTYKYRPGWTYAEMGGAMLAYAGPSISLSCLTNFFAFLVGYFVPLPSINQFAYAAMIGVAVNYFMILIGWTAILTLDAKRVRANRMDCLFCFKARTDERDVKPNEGNSSGFWRHWADATLSVPGKVIILIVGIGVFIAACVGSATIDVGLPLADIVPKDHYAHEFLKQRETNFGAFSAGLITGMNRQGAFIKYDYSDTDVQRKILATERRMEYVYGYSASLPMRSVSALDLFLQFINTDAGSSVFLNPNDTYTFPSFNPLNYTPNPYPAMTVKMCYKDFFYSALNNWLNLPGTGSAVGSQIEFDDNGFINAFKLQFFEENLFTLPDIIEHIYATRDITDTSEIACFPAGFVYNLYEQYLNVRKYLASHLGYVTIAVVLCLLTILFNPLAVLVLVGVLVMITVEVYGFLHWFDLKLNGVSVVNMIMGVGQSVEFTVHITRFFMVFTGTRHERANQALRLMCFPLLNGAVTTLIGIFPMAFAKFPYFTLYFFYQYLIILVAGLFNGIFFLPVVLSLIGPPTLSLGHDKTATDTA